MATGGGPLPRSYGLEEFRRFFFLQGTPWVLWLGSWTSIERPAGVPGVGPMLEALMGELGAGREPAVPEADGLLAQAGQLLGVLRKRRVPFEVILGQVSDHTGSFVQTYLQNVTPPSAAGNPNHRAAADLALGSPSVMAMVDLVVTTNFDECLETASGHRLNVLVPQEGSFGAPPSPGLLKLHGTISDPASLGTTPAALARRDTPEWSDSLTSCLAGRNVLFVGYSFSDAFDITPALRAAALNGARFYWACKSGDISGGLPVPIEATIPHDLKEARRNLLRVLVPTASQGFGPPAGFGDPELVKAQRGCAAARADTEVTVAQKLAALGALHYWLEQGQDAVRYFTVASRCPGSRVDRHSLARAFSRSRRFLAAVRLFDLMLASDLPEDPTDRAVKEIDWIIGAGFCAATGGRPMLASRYYRRARRAYNEARRRRLLDGHKLHPYLADQLLRSQADQEVKLALWHSGRDGHRHLERASRYLDVLEAVGGLELATRPLVPLERARIELARGDRQAALECLTRARERVDPLRDPHTSSVCRRLIAVASRDRSAQRELAAEAWTDGRRIEWAKICAEWLGFDGYSRAPALTYAVRSLLLVSWDWVKDRFSPAM